MSEIPKERDWDKDNGRQAQTGSIQTEKDRKRRKRQGKRERE